MGQNAIDMQNSGTGAEIAARPLVDKNADTNKPSGIAAAVANGNTSNSGKAAEQLAEIGCTISFIADIIFAITDMTISCIGWISHLLYLI